MSQKTDRERIVARNEAEKDPAYVHSYFPPEILRAIIDELINGCYTYVGYRKAPHGCWSMMFHRQYKNYWREETNQTSSATWEREDVNRVIHALRSAGIKKFKQIKQLKPTDLRKIEEEYNQAVEAV